MFDSSLSKQVYIGRLINRRPRMFFRTGIACCLAASLMLFDLDELQAQQIGQCYPPLPLLQVEPEKDDEFGVRTNSDIDQIIRSDQPVVHTSDQAISADTFNYQDQQGVLEAIDNVTIMSENLQIYGESATLLIDQEILTITKSEFNLFEKDKNDPSIRYQRGRGSAEGIRLDNHTVHLDTTEFTLCPEGNTDVEIVASKLTVNSENRQGIARNVVMRFKGIPVLYTPYLRFPIGSERISGFLYPSFSSSNKTGTAVTVPYYFNLAPNRDATLTTAYYSKRGVQLQGEYRYLGANSDFILVGEYMPKDKEFTDREKRYGAGLAGKWHDGGSLYSSVDASWISDRSYLADYSGLFSDQDVDFLQRNISFSYENRGLLVSTGINQFITSEMGVPDTREPYNRVPWVAVDYLTPLTSNSSFSSSIAWDKFKHNDKPNGGRRLRAETAVSTRVGNAFSELEMEIGGEYLKYKLSAPGANQSATMSADSAYASLDAKLFFDRFHGDGSGRRWTLVPRVKLLATESVEQDNLPNFDTSLTELDAYYRLFQDSPYIGGDRLRETNQVSVGVSANYYDPANSSDLASVGFGRVFYPDGKATSLGDQPDVLPKKSDLFLETKFQNNATKLQYTSLFSTETNKISSSSLRFSHHISENAEFMSVYRHSREDKSQWGNAISFKPGTNWKILLQAIKSFDPNQLEEARLTFDYQSCCSRLMVIFERERRTNGTYDNSVSLTFDLTPSI